MIKKTLSFLFLSLFCTSSQILFASHGSKGLGHFTKEIITQDQCSAMIEESFASKHWADLLKWCDIFEKRFSSATAYGDVYYYKGIGYFNKKDFDLSNRAFSRYLTMNCAPQHFEEIFYYKFAIAEQFRKGAKKRMFKGDKSLKIVPAKDEAITIYDEVIHSLPFHELTPHAYFGKALILTEQEDYLEAIETLQQLIQKFPKHDLTVESYLQISKIYLLEASPKRQDPDLLDLAQLNVMRFAEAFPGEVRLKTAKKLYLDMEEKYAEGLFEIGRFFERTNKKAAAKIYYQKILASFPHTPSASLTKTRIAHMDRKKRGAK